MLMRKNEQAGELSVHIETSGAVEGLMAECSLREVHAEVYFNRPPPPPLLVT